MLKTFKQISCSKIKRLINSFLKIILIISLVFTYIYSTFQVSTQALYFGTINVYAQETNTNNTTSNANPTSQGLNVFGSVGFSECRIVESSGTNSQPSNTRAETRGSQSTALAKCVSQIVQFFFVVALFIVAIRIALESLTSLNPFDKGKAIDNTIGLIKDIIFGLILLGSPAVLLNLFSSATLNINNILNLQQSESQSAPQDPTQNNTNNNNQNNTNNNNTTQQGTVNAKIGSKTIDILSSPEGLTTEEKRQLDTLRNTVVLNLLQGKNINEAGGGAISLSSNFNLSSFINSLANSTSLNENQKTLVANLSNMNKSIKNASLKSIDTDTYEITRANCTSTQCKYQAILVNTSCGNSVTNTKVTDDTLPKQGCYFVPLNTN
jgi:hypothetical protein